MKSVNAGKGEQNAEHWRGFYWLFKLLGTFLGMLLEMKCQNQPWNAPVTARLSKMIRPNLKKETKQTKWKCGLVKKAWNVDGRNYNLCRNCKKIKASLIYKLLVANFYKFFPPKISFEVGAEQSDSLFAFFPTRFFVSIFSIKFLPNVNFTSTTKRLPFFTSSVAGRESCL